MSLLVIFTAAHAWRTYGRLASVFVIIAHACNQMNNLHPSRIPLHSIPSSYNTTHYTCTKIW